MNTYHLVRRSLLLITALTLVVGAWGAPAAHTATTRPFDYATTRVQPDWGKMPLYFIANQGQMDDRVAYYVQGSDKTLYFASEGVTFALTQKVSADARSRRFSAQEAYSSAPNESSRWIVKLDFVDANAVRPSGQAQTEAVISYFKGSRDEWRTGLPTYSQIVYPDLWEGIDLVYSGTVNRLKYEFVVKPGADPAAIRLAYRGATVRVNDAGQLEVSTPAGGFQDDAPVAYQEVAGQRVPVAVAYALEDAARWGADEVGTDEPRPYGFHVGAYNPALPLVIDPTVLVYCGYIGGGGDDYGYGIAVDAAGNAYVTGDTASTEATFPETVGPDVTHNDGEDAFVAKVNASGSALVYAGYIGGSADDRGFGIAVDSAGNAYVTGDTNSTQATFPVTVGPDLTYNGGPWDAFVAKVNASGTALVYAGYIGGNNYESGYGIAVDSAGNAYVTGNTYSTEATFPVTIGPDLTHNGSSDAFVAKVDASGTALVYAGYIGGSGGENGYGIAVDTAGNAYVMGDTYSTEATFPETMGPDLIYNGGGDAFAAKVNASGTELVYAGYIGGSDTDYGIGIAVDAAGNAYVTGYTSSTEATFPETVGPDLTHNGGWDAFVAKVNASGSALVYAGYIGGSDYDNSYGIAVDTAGNAYVTGNTWSTEATFPVAVGPDVTYNGIGDAFVAKVNASGSALVYAGYIGGSGDDYGRGIAVDSAGNAYVTGFTASTEATFPVTIGPDLTHNGGIRDAFVAKVPPEKTYADTAGACGSNLPCYTTIGGALNAVMVNGSVDVHAGTYNESVSLDSGVNLTLLGATTLSGNLTLSAGTFNAPSANTFSLTGNLTNSGGTLNHNSGTVIFSGSGAQNLDASVATTFNNLTVNSGVTLVETVSADNVTVAGTLTNSGTIRKTQSVSGAGSKTFGLAGRYNGADLSVNVTTQGSLSQLQVDRVDSNHPNAVAATQTGRYWSITPTGSSYTIDLTLPHNVSTPGTNAYVCRNTGGTNWMCGRTSATANTVTRTELTTLSDWAVGDSSKGPLAVRLANFQATVAGHQVVVTWETVSELDVQGFHLYRAESAAGPWQRLDAGLIPSAAPGSANGHTYAFSDRDVQGGRTYWYRLEAVDLAGGIQALGLTSVTVRPTAAAPRLWLPWVGW